MKLFTKSAFKQALSCPASLYYYFDREHYANQMNEDDFLQALADGGNQVGDLAKVYYDVQPDADLASIMGYDQSVERTKELFKKDTINIAEAAFRWENCFVRADIIEKKGKVINLIEVKAKSWDKNKDVFEKGGSVSKGILEYVYDVAFQKYVIQNALGPDYKVVAHLMLADKTVLADYNGINQLFHVVKTPDGKSAIVRQADAAKLREYNQVLTAFGPDYGVDQLADRIIEGATGEQESLMGCKFQDFVKEMSRQYVNHERHFCPVSNKCFDCPFYSNEKTPGLLDGKKECWQEVENFTEEDFARPSVSELWCGLLGAKPLKKELVAARKFFMSDLKEDDIPESKPVDSGLKPSDRRILQIALTNGDDAMLAPFKANMHDGVYLDIPGLSAEMATWQYPLHMIDFETTAVALPLYKGLHPYEQVAFQFSHHIIRRDGTIEHVGQYLNTVPLHNPNFDFVRELKRQLETDNGTIFRYATHENSILRAMHDQLANSDAADKQELMTFIDSITHYKDGRAEIAGPRDMVDLLEMVRKYYYHPSMKGSNSIKVVLPAILNSSKAIQAKYSKPIYGSLIPSQNFKNGATKAWISYGPDGKVENPYKHLDSIATFLGVTDDELERFDSTYKPEGESIANGGAALAAYTKLQFSTPAEAKALAEALLRYCELDTMSMVFIWEYFHENTGI